MMSLQHKNDPPNWQAIRFTLPVIVKAVSIALLLCNLVNAQIVDPATMDALAGVSPILSSNPQTLESIRLRIFLTGGRLVKRETPQPFRVRGMTPPSGCGKLKYLGHGEWGTR